MLMQIRERATGVLAYIIIILIAIPFALWGVHEYFTGPSDAIVAEVNGQEIPKRFFDSQLQQQRRYLRSLLGDSFNTIYSDETKLKQNVVDQIVETQLLEDVTISAGYRISDQQVFERIQAAPEFQVNGQFDRTRYQNLLASQNRSAVEIEEQIRQQERLQQFQNGILVTSFLPNEQKKNFGAIKNQKRQFDYFIVNEKVDVSSISRAEIEDTYEQNKQKYKTAPKVKLNYLEIKQQDIADAIDFEEDEIKAAYEDELDRYSSPELRKPSHILFKLAAEAGEEDIASAFTKAIQAIDRIKSGETFAVVAEELSDDSISAKRGGDLGFISRSDIDNPEFISKLFSMEEGTISEPVRTQLGVQVIQLNEITAPKAKPFAEVREQVLTELRGDAAESEFVQQVEQLQDLTYQHEDSLSIAAEEIGISVATTDWVESIESTGIASYPKVIAAAFSEEVLAIGRNSELIELTDGHVVVIRVAEHEEAKIQTLEEVREVIADRLAQKKSLDNSITKGKQYVEQLRASPSGIDAIISDNDYTLESPAAVLRNDKSIDGSILSLAFRIPLQEGALPKVIGGVLEDNGYVIIKLNNVVASDADVEAAEWNVTLSNYGRRELTAIKNALRETEDVRVFEENL